MALAKHCRHLRAQWNECSCAWYVDYRIAGKRAYKRLGVDRLAAEREHRVLQQRLKRGQLVKANAGQAFDLLADRWFRAAALRIGPNTVDGYRSALAHALRWLESGPVSAITAGVITEMEADLLAAGLSPAYVRQVRGVVMQVLGYAVDLGLIPHVPQMRRRASVKRAEPRFLEVAEAEAIIAGLVEPFASMSELAWLTGLRPGEVVALPHQEIAGAVLHVRHTVHSRTGALGPTKSRESRSVDLSPRAQAAAERLSAGVRSYTTWLRYCHDAQARLGIPPAGLHVWRHSNVALRIEAGQPITYIADQLGHSTAAFTLKQYGHLLRVKRDASELDRAVALIHGA